MQKILSFCFLLLIYPVFLEAQAPHFTYTANTGDSYSIVIDEVSFHGAPLQNGDEIGVFTPAGLCVGASVWTGTAPLALTAWADDAQTQVIDGYTTGEAMSFRIWQTATQSESEATPHFKKGHSHFGDGAYCVVSLFVFQSTQGEIIVTTTADTGKGSLRWALEKANSTIGKDTIVFHIPETDVHFDTSSGVWTISPQSALPTLTDSNLVLDGSSQQIFVGEDMNPEGPEIEIDGHKAGNCQGFYLSAPGIEILELIVNRFQKDGIMVSSVRGGRVAGCYIGVSSDGLEPAPNGRVGVFLNGTREFEISQMDSIPTIVSGNKLHGIYLSGASKNRVSGSIVGLNRTKTDTIGNAYEGIYIVSGDSNRIVKNVIGGNKMSNGIQVSEGIHNTISANIIGWNPDRPDRILGNSGSGIVVTASDNLISENSIAFNHVYGVSIVGEKALRNTITHNLIFRNGWGGINTEQGGNRELATPVLTEVTRNSVSGTASPQTKVELFADKANQGSIFLGTITADTAGTFHWSGDPLPTNFFCTATATDSAGNTSEFSEAMKISTAVKESAAQKPPAAFSLSQNYPNPFNPDTRIHFTLSATVEQPVRVQLCIYNLRGELVRRLVNEEKRAGSYWVHWNGLNDVGRRVATGVYLYRLTTPSATSTKKMILVK